MKLRTAHYHTTRATSNRSEALSFTESRGSSGGGENSAKILRVFGAAGARAAASQNCQGSYPFRPPLRRCQKNTALLAARCPTRTF